jgi:hypothetical protein
LEQVEQQLQFDPAGGLEPVTKGQPGNNSVFGAAAPLTAIGGGGGVRGISGTPKAGNPGGSGGGGYLVVMVEQEHLDKEMMVEILQFQPQVEEVAVEQEQQEQMCQHSRC